MLDRTIVVWTIAACMSAIPVAAQAPAPTTTAFDGTYAGVSRTYEGGIDAVDQGALIIAKRDCVPNGQPGTQRSPAAWRGITARTSAKSPGKGPLTRKACWSCAAQAAADWTPRSMGAAP
jgi:hypothetical protein